MNDYSTIIVLLLCICTWKLWQIEKWLKRLRITSMTPQEQIGSRPQASQKNSVHPPKEEQPRRGTGKKGDPLIVSAAEYRKMAGLD